MSIFSSSMQNKIRAIRFFLRHIFFFFIIVALYFYSNHELEKQSRAEQVVACTSMLSKLYYDSGLAIAAYSLTKNDAFASRYEKLKEQIPETIENLDLLVKQQPIQGIEFTDIQLVAKQGLDQLEVTKQAIDNNPSSSFMSNQTEIRGLYKKIKLISEQLQNKLDQLSQSEQNLTKNCPQNRLVLQILLAISFISYVLYNIVAQRKFNKTIYHLDQPTSTN